MADRVAIVTGASSGIGEATAKQLAGEGYAVVLAARREAELERVADEINGDALVVPTDLAEEPAAEALVEETLAAFGRLDLLVNNAGVLASAPVVDADRAAFEHQIRVNLLGVMHTTHAALPALLESGGDIVTVSSMNARYPAEGASAYTASKFGANGFCRSLRKELSEEEVRVTVVMPGPVVSGMNDWAEWDGRPLAPEDVAETVAFAVSRPDHVELPELTVNTTDKLA